MKPISFKERIAIAKKLRRACDGYIVEQYRRICLICYWAYVKECVLKGKTNFTVKFKGRYLRSFSNRIKDWIVYIGESIYRFFLLIRYPKTVYYPLNDSIYENLTFYKYCLIKHGASKPVHLKISNPPNEAVLERFLNDNGFELVDEILLSNDSIYAVSPIRYYN